jgi:hypothetical protein
MDEFEYKFEKVDYSLLAKGDDKLREVCNFLGKKGWELVSARHRWFANDYHLFFKRKIK